MSGERSLEAIPSGRNFPLLIWGNDAVTLSNIINVLPAIRSGNALHKELRFKVG